MSILKNPERLGTLLASIGVSNYDRPLSPIEVSNEISTLLKELKNNKHDLVNRLPITQDMVDGFLRLQLLPAEIQKIVVWGNSNKINGSISFSSAHNIAQLLKNTSDNEAKTNVLKLCAAIFERSTPVTKTEIKRIIALKNRTDKTIEECIADVLNVTRINIIKRFLLISSINTNILKYLQNFSTQNKKNINIISLSLLLKIFPNDSIKSVQINNNYIKLAFSENGHDFFHKYVKKNNLLQKDAINHIFNKVINK